MDLIESKKECKNCECECKYECEKINNLKKEIKKEIKEEILEELFITIQEDFQKDFQDSFEQLIKLPEISSVSTGIKIREPMKKSVKILEDFEIFKHD